MLGGVKAGPLKKKELFFHFLFFTILLNHRIGWQSRRGLLQYLAKKLALSGRTTKKIIFLRLP